MAAPASAKEGGESAAGAAQVKNKDFETEKKNDGTAKVFENDKDESSVNDDQKVTVENVDLEKDNRREKLKGDGSNWEVLEDGKMY